MQLEANYFIRAGFAVPPGWNAIKISNSEIVINVRFFYPETVVVGDQTFNVADCICAQLFWEVPNADVTNIPQMEAFFWDGLEAITEVLIWIKHRKLGKISTYSRQIGISDVKIATLKHKDQWEVAACDEETFQLTPIVKQASQLFENTRHASNALIEPMDNQTRRAYATVDMINGGFYTESFINIFALADDLIQSLWEHEFKKRGFNRKKRKQITYVKEHRLDHYLNTLPASYGWKPLSMSDSALAARIAKNNLLRNDIMHGSMRLTRGSETLPYVNTVLEMIVWMESNPYGFHVPSFPDFVALCPKFVIIRGIPTDDKNGVRNTFP